MRAGFIIILFLLIVMKRNLVLAHFNWQKPLLAFWLLLSSLVASNAQDSIVYKLNQYFRKIDNTDFSYRRVIKKLNDSTWEQFDYTRLGNPYQQIFFKDTNLKIRHGKYTLFNSKNKVDISGFYQNNMPVNTWFFYNPGKNHLIDSLDYNFYSNLKKQFSGQLLPDSIRFNSEIDKEAGFPGGEKAWKRFLSRNFEGFLDEFPAAAHKEIHVSFMIDRSGNMVNVYPVKSIDPKIDREIISVLKTSPKWIPAEQDNKKVIAIIIQPISF